MIRTNLCFCWQSIVKCWLGGKMKQTGFGLQPSSYCIVLLIGEVICDFILFWKPLNEVAFGESSKSIGLYLHQRSASHSRVMWVAVSSSILHNLQMVVFDDPDCVKMFSKATVPVLSPVINPISFLFEL